MHTLQPERVGKCNARAMTCENHSGHAMDVAGGAKCQHSSLEQGRPNHVYKW